MVAGSVRCMVAETSAMYLDNPVQQMASIVDFLNAVLDPGKPGMAAVRPREPDGIPGGVDGWLSGDDAVRWVAQRAPAWLDLARDIEGAPSGSTALQAAFHEIARWTNVIRVFFDASRFAACAGSPPGRGAWPAYFLLTSDWSVDEEGTTSWCPQVVAMTHWPESRQLAPRPTGLPAASGLDPAAAAALLDETLLASVWKFGEFREGFGLPSQFHRFPTDYFEHKQITLSPPVFYGVFVGGMQSHTDLLEENGQTTIRTLAGVALGRGVDIDSHELVAGIADKRFLTYRREPVGEETSRPYYLAVTADQGGTLLAHDEERFAYVADHLAYLNSRLAGNVTDVAPKLLELMPRLSIANASLARTDEITQHLREHAMLRGLTSGRRRQLEAQMQSIGLAFTESAHRVANLLAELDSAESGWDEAVEDVREELLQRVHSENLPGQDPDTGPRPLASVRSYVAVTEVGRLPVLVRRTGTMLRARYEQSIKDWQAMVQYVTGVARERGDQQNRTIQLGLAGVGLLAAVPIIVGNLGGQELRDEIAGWDGALAPLRHALTAVHTPLLALAILGAAGVAIYLLVRLVGMVIGELFPDRSLVPMGDLCRRAWDTNRQAGDVVKELRAEGSPQRRAELLAQLDDLDLSLSAALARLLERLGELQREAAQSSGPLDRIGNRIRAFALWLELFQNRHIPLRTPRAALLYRHKSHEVGGEHTVPFSELDSVLWQLGWEKRTRERADALARDAARTMGPTALVDYLGSVGIVPSRTGWVEEVVAPAGPGAPPSQATAPQTLPTLPSIRKSEPGPTTGTLPASRPGRPLVPPEPRSGQ